MLIWNYQCKALILIVYILCIWTGHLRKHNSHDTVALPTLKAQAKCQNSLQKPFFLSSESQACLKHALLLQGQCPTSHHEVWFFCRTVLFLSHHRESWAISLCLQDWYQTGCAQQPLGTVSKATCGTRAHSVIFESETQGLSPCFWKSCHAAGTLA